MLLSLIADASFRLRGGRLVATGRWRHRAAQITGILEDIGISRGSAYRFNRSLMTFGIAPDERQRLMNALASVNL